MNENLRREVRLTKALHGTTYKELADQLKVKKSSFYSWLKGQYDFSFQKQRELQTILSEIKE